MKEAIVSRGAPAAIGPYSQGVRAGGMLFLSGQIALDPGTGEIIAGDVAAQTERAMKNLAALLSAAGSGFEDVVRTTIYVVDLANYSLVNEVYSRFFRAPFPARTTVEVAALPRGAEVEIDVIAVAAVTPGQPAVT